MPIELRNIIISAISMIISALVSWLISVLIKFLNRKIKNKEVAAFSATILTVVTNAVKATMQTFVDNIKGTTEWTDEAKRQALNLALATAKSELTTEALAYIESQHGDINSYLKTLIESILFDLKQQKSTVIEIEQ